MTDRPQQALCQFEQGIPSSCLICLIAQDRPCENKSARRQLTPLTFSNIACGDIV
jgi:hypothetical protein